MKNESRNNRHNHNQRIKVLRLLERNDFNYLKTHRESGVSRETIKRWEKVYGKEVFHGKSPTEEALIEIDAEMKNNDINIIRTLYVIRKRTLQKLLIMAESETKIDPLLNLLKHASIEIQKFSDMEKQEPEKISDARAFFELVSSQMTKQSNDRQFQSENEESL
jgi:hypothetical protein